MDSIEALARQMMGQQVDEAVDNPDVESIKRFLHSRQGHEAARSAIDRLVFNANLGRPLQNPPHKEIIKTIEGIMSGQSGSQQEAAAVDPMNVAAAQHAGFNRQDYAP